MRILEVIPLLSIDGGAESFVVYFCNELIHKGHECALLTLYSVDDKVRNKVSLSSQVKMFNADKKKGLDIVCAAKVMSVIKTYAPDVVHVHVGAIPYVSLSAICYRKCKYFATIHSEARREAGRNYQKWSRQILFRSGRVKAVAISDSSWQSFIDFYKTTPALIYNGVPCLSGVIRHNNTNDKIRFIHVARCHPIKNQMLLIKAFRKVLQNHDGIELDWYGSSAEYPELFESIKQLFNNHIHYLGSTIDARLEMGNADALCLSSKMEGMPMTIIEALSVGCIPICTPVGGCVDMIEDGINGFLAADNSVKSYSEALERFIKTNEETRETLRINAIQSFKDKFSIEKTVNDYIALFSC